ncbi:replication protein RepA [Candidatus Enterovibrio altilux]|uniref:replication protein RepA n=1 Tax=Candidatus Enterovibrio altilux TaxID=1927128 RepID=UPI001681BB65|nr:replication protein RepA [Candidatus Enterovibrio luxaltus]
MKEQETVFLNSKLVCNSSKTIQPNILLRTGVFTPIGRRSKANYVSIDLSNEFRNLELCQQEGYDDVSIKGVKLSVETDFKIWCGIILSFSELGGLSNKITLKFSQFAAYCGYPSKRFDKNLRRQIGDSLGRIQSQSLSFQRKNAVKGVHTGLLAKAVFDEVEDIVILVADESLWDLYQLDYQVLVSIKVLKQLPRAEVAQCLYLYFVSLPEKPYPISFERLKIRLQLRTTNKEANRLITKGIQKLENIGFMIGQFIKKNGKNYYLIEKRYSKLKDVPSHRPIERYFLCPEQKLIRDENFVHICKK